MTELILSLQVYDYSEITTSPVKDDEYVRTLMVSITNLSLRF